MISNAKIRINLKEANENTEKSLTNPRKDWEIRIFKGFLNKYSTRTKSTFSGKSQGTSHKQTNIDSYSMKDYLQLGIDKCLVEMSLTL